MGGVTTKYVYDINAGLPVLVDDGTETYVWGAAGIAYAVSKSSGATTTFHTDGLGSVRALTNANGSVVQIYQTDAFGVPVAGGPLGSAGSAGQPLQYTGEPRDLNGLLYLRARTYDPISGRFLRSDPLRNSGPGIGGWNRYAYVGNNPIRFTDPSGFCVDPASVGVGTTSAIRYCIERYIPTPETSVPLPLLGLVEFHGDARGPSSSGGTFRVQQLISIGSDGSVAYREDTGISYGLGLSEKGQLGSCGFAASVSGDTTTIAAACEAWIGVLGQLAPPIYSYFVIQQSQNGKARILAASGTSYPSAELWQYGGPSGTQQLYHYDPQDYGHTPLSLFVPQTLPIQSAP